MGGHTPMKGQVRTESNSPSARGPRHCKHAVKLALNRTALIAETSPGWEDLAIGCSNGRQREK
jgi:hypothetical protein